jgi:DNA (cytosine-5)-methyltransferase 1
MENVPNLAAMSGGELINEIEQDFSNLGYTLSRRILLASDYGVPQNRKRLFLVGTLSDVAFSWPQKTTPHDQDKVNTYEAIGDLPEHSLDDGSAYPSPPKSPYQKLMREDSHGVNNHQVTKHEEKTIRIIDMVPDGGNYKNLPEEFRRTRKVNIAWTRFSSTLPSPTIDTGHRHHFHYEHNRVPTVRESARLQSFPDTFHFYGSKTSQYRQVGNAVPPLLAQQLGIAIENYLRKN